MSVKEIPLEQGKRIYFSKRIENNKVFRKIFVENPDGSVDQVVYGDNQKRHPVVIKRVAPPI